jgi:hypothetical protein
MSLIIGFCTPGREHGVCKNIHISVAVVVLCLCPSSMSLRPSRAFFCFNSSARALSSAKCWFGLSGEGCQQGGFSGASPNAH